MGGGNRPNRTCSGRIGQPQSRGDRITRWFDTSCFPVPAAFTYGSDSRTNPDVRGPGFTQLDFGLEKGSSLFKEKARFIPRVEAFNILNTPHFNPPQRNAGANNFGQLFESNGMPGVIQCALEDYLLRTMYVRPSRAGALFSRWQHVH
ncbi:MAG TPA: hypothetical protein VL285_18705 [Bryobacteraceae bacterium]|nr:hypothetical protein [Bryobacteraceae bacterium]